MSAPPYMRLYWGDYHRDTVGLTRAEHGSYLLLLSALWSSGGKLADDDTMLARLALCTADEWQASKPLLMRFFHVSRGRISHKRLSAELARYEDVLIKRKAAGKAGGSVKRGKDTENGEANAKQTPHNQNHNQNHKDKKETPSVLPRGSRLAEDWRPDPEDVVYATVRGLAADDIERAGEKFRNYWTAKAGKDATKIDWRRTWQNWVLDEVAKRPVKSARREVNWC